jgi:cobalt-zinc-cadmium efflux system membrane fusion protein
MIAISRLRPLFTCALVLELGLLAGCSQTSQAGEPSPPPPNTVFVSPAQLEKMKVTLATVDLEDVDDMVLTTGKVAFDDQKVEHVFSPVTGKVVKVLAQLGSSVKKGDALVLIDSPDIGVATSDLGKADADLVAAMHEYQRQNELSETHATSQKELELAADNYRKAKAELDRAQQKARLFRQGDVTGQTYTLRADLDGEVFMKAVAPGMELAGQYAGGNSTELFTIGRTDRVWVLADVFELDVARVKLGAKVTVGVVSAPDRSFEGKVDWISNSLDPSTHATKVRCTFDNPDGALKPEMFASVRISVAAKQALAIPRSAVLRLGDQTVVFVERGTANGKQRFERLPVSVDEAEASDWLSVTHGLERGERIVTSGAILLSGML